MPCFALATLMVACLGYVPDTSAAVSVPRHCVKRLGSHVVKAKACAAENGVTWRIIGKRKWK
jgi:hypothetical protein